jgi:hypothetical protein
MYDPLYQHGGPSAKRFLVSYPTRMPLKKKTPEPALNVLCIFAIIQRWTTKSFLKRTNEKKEKK